ncbi:MAG TPA: sorbosone dehydrogenase, partial [Pelagibacterium sp.]|nr:sorbosone dehydrogenase [Pelagibacterium sp.]
MSVWTILLVIAILAVVIIGGGYVWWTTRVKTHAPQFGTKPAIPSAKPQGAVPMLKMPT